jgi:hypothetical protein
MPAFRLDHAASLARTHGLGSIDLPPKALVDRFGPPRPFDDYKVSGNYTFVDDAGLVYTLYDYKVTSLYNDPALGYPQSPTPQEFWADDTPTTLNIGGTDACDVPAFKVWLRYEV